MVTVRVAYLGPPGTYSHQAARQQFEPYTLEDESVSIIYLPQASIAGCFKSIDDDQCDYSLVPFENSSNGQVVLAYDLYRDWFVRESHRDSGKFKEPEFEVIAEQFVPIHHNLISFGSDLSKIEQIYSHPQVWSQCNRFLEELETKSDHKIEKIDISSTSKAVYLLNTIKSRERRSKCAAIASSTASEIHGVPIRRSNIEDFDGNTTRFLVMGRKQRKLLSIDPVSNKKLSDKKMTLLTFIIKDNDNFGSLCNILEVFKQHNLNLQTITTRPSIISPWRYVFFVEIWYSEELTTALAELQAEVLNLTVIGSFYRSKKFFDMVGAAGNQ
ncbi:DEKNAAC100743 [Brettanomyces naardenensis]|uniref:prephenate dehydratase n=1 Tax=Brettanomyces naardenensis TaxID=13370 RepID=A0A448YFN9_BRENA|nr:DEKNAAC100743 [Brettanomyces naardenensis]